MTIAREDFEAYAKAVDALAAEASEAAESEVLDWCAGNPGATTEQARMAAIDILSRVQGVYDDAAASLAAEWYDETVVAGHGKLKSAITGTVSDRKGLIAAVHYQAGKYDGDDVEGFARSCGEYAANSAMRSVNRTVLRNAERDSGSGVRYARICVGGACAFCLMLGSRGAVYWSRESAGENGRFHRRCRCKIVAGQGSGPIVEGYDPQAIRERMALMERQTGLRFSNGGDLEGLSRYLRLHGNGWATFGDAQPVDYSLNSRGNYGTMLEDGSYLPENIVSRGNEWRDLFAHDALSANGFKVTARPDIPTAAAARGTDGVSNPDIFINDELWEIKSPCTTDESGDGLRFVGSAFKKAKRNFGNPYDPYTGGAVEGFDGTRRVVLNLRYRRLSRSYQEVERTIVNEMSSRGIAEVICIEESGEMHWYSA